MGFKRFLLVIPAVTALAATQAALALDGQVLVASGLQQPLLLTAPAGDGRLFVAEKGGAIRLMVGGALQATPFLDLSTKVDTSGERGLLGLAFDPNYASNGRFYVNYIDKTTLNTVVERYQVAGPGANVANAASAQLILDIAQPAGRSNHKGGWMGFRPGDTHNLFIATGDGGSSNDPDNNAQNPGSLLGKMLRIDVSGAGTGYAIPTDNPFAGTAGVRQEIWSSGLRNPFRNSFDRQTGDLWIGDVGQGVREEINFEFASASGGANYGWRLREGTVATPVVGGTAPGLIEPIFDYTHQNAGGLGDSVIGGYVYRGPGIADADGRYFFGDFVSNRIFSFVLGAGNTPTDLRDDTAAFIGGTGLSGLDSFGEDGLGRLYAVGVNGVIVQLVPESQTYALMLAGLAYGALCARRHRSRGT